MGRRRGVSTIIAGFIVISVILFGILSYYMVLNKLYTYNMGTIDTIHVEAERANERLYVEAYPDTKIVSIENIGSVSSRVVSVFSSNNESGLIKSTDLNIIIPVRQKKSFEFDNMTTGTGWVTGVVTDLGNIFYANIVENSSGSEGYEYFQGEVDVLDQYGVSLKAKTSRINHFNITEYAYKTQALDYAYHLLANATVSSSSIELVNEIGSLSWSQTSSGMLTHSEEEEFMLSDGTLVKVDSTVYSRYDGSDNLAWFKLIFTLTFQDSNPRIILYKEPDKIDVYSNSGSVNNDSSGLGDVYGVGWRRFISTSSSAVINYTSTAHTPSGSPSGETWNYYAESDYDDQNFRIIILEIKEVITPELTQATNFNEGKYNFTHIAGDMKTPYQLGFTNLVEKSFTNSISIAFYNRFANTIYQKYLGIDDRVNSVGGSELIYVYKLISVKDSVELYQEIATLSWVLTPDLLDNGGDPYKVVDTDGETMHGTIFTEPVKSDNGYMLFKVTNYLPVDLHVDVEGLGNIVVQSESTSIFNVTQTPNPGIYNIILYPDVDWNNPYKVLYYYLYCAEWRMIIPPKN